MNCNCVKCGHAWVSGLSTPPKLCPVCKRRDWTGMHNSMGRPLAAGAQVVTVPAAVAPVISGVPCTCRLCGGSWVSRSAATVPVQCPKCKKTKWADVSTCDFDPDGLLTTGRCECRKCGKVWVSKVSAGLPRQCPGCKSDAWSPAAVARFYAEKQNPVMADCPIKWFKIAGKPFGDPITGVHQYQVNAANPGYCGHCGWNNRTNEQVGINYPPPLTEAEKERRKRQWEKEHPGEVW